jgi:hypothetical protein
MAAPLLESEVGVRVYTTSTQWNERKCRRKTEEGEERKGLGGVSDKVECERAGNALFRSFP